MLADQDFFKTESIFCSRLAPFNGLLIIQHKVPVTIWTDQEILLSVSCNQICWDHKSVVSSISTAGLQSFPSPLSLGRLHWISLDQLGPSYDGL